ncbi:Uncharacterised protein [Klebsiella pneumoniae]|nr:Uncharacterised protein [Klebsiella pneumoniae]
MPSITLVICAILLELVAISSIVRTTPSTTLPPFFAVEEASSARRDA